MELDSQYHSEISHDSFPLHQPKRKIKNPEYLSRLELFRQNLKPLNQFNNVETQMNDLGKKKNAQNKNVTRRTQTYERDIAIGYDPFDRDGDVLITDEDRAIEYDPDFAKDLLKNLIDNLSDLPSSTKEKESDIELDSQGFVRRKRRVTRENFDLDDILGTFNIDDFGNIILDVKA